MLPFIKPRGPKAFAGRGTYLKFISGVHMIHGFVTGVKSVKYGHIVEK